jgi:hypothetical protein
MSDAVGQEGLYHPIVMEAIAERGETYKSCVAPLDASRFAPALPHIAICDFFLTIVSHYAMFGGEGNRIYFRRRPSMAQTCRYYARRSTSN